jgi:hypothetical protein
VGYSESSNPAPLLNQGRVSGRPRRRRTSGKCRGDIAPAVRVEERRQTPSASDCSASESGLKHP